MYDPSAWPKPVQITVWGRAKIAGGKAVSAGCIGQSTGDEYFVNPGSPGDNHVLGIRYPVTAG